MLNIQASIVATYADCQGCSLCILPCPMWLQYRDVMFSPQGIAKAMQSGAQAEDLREPLSTCIQCGACDVMCPENIDLTAMVSQAWQEIGLPIPDAKTDNELSPFVTSCDAIVQSKINEDDFYIIDAAVFHAHHAERVMHYDALRKQTGCSMNLDLNRVAIPTGIGSLAIEQVQFDVKLQVQWLTQGRDFNRIIVENAAEVEVLQELTDKPVMCVSELLRALEVRSENAAS